MKKTTFLVFLGLIATGGVGAYAFSDGMFDEIIEDFEETEEEIVEEKEPEVISTDIMAIINVNSYTGINYYQMEEVDDGTITKFQLLYGIIIPLNLTHPNLLAR